MSEIQKIQKIFQKYVNVVDTLRIHFYDKKVALKVKENESQYDLSADTNVFWLRKYLPSLAEKLFPANFQIIITIEINDSKVKLNICDRHPLMYKIKNPESIEEEILDSIPEEAVSDFENFIDELKRAGQNELPLENIYILLERLFNLEIIFSMKLQLFLNKCAYIIDEFKALIDKNKHLEIASFLFPESFLTILESYPLKKFEEEFFQHGKRSVIIIFGFNGFLRSDFLTISGNGYDRRLYDSSNKPLSEEILQRTTKILNFRKSEVLWFFPTTWLVPDTFEFNTVLSGNDNEFPKLHRQLKSFQALLSAVFLADNVDVDSMEDKYYVEYKGPGKVRLPLERSSLLEYEKQFPNLYGLYSCVYERFSPDKLEIAQQFLSVMVENIESLFKKATEIKLTTKKTYDRVLVGKVKEYFDARHKIQERIKTAVTESSNDVISLSRDLSADLYKITGVIVLAVAGAILKPDFSLWAALIASIVTTIHLALVIFYHLPNLKRTYTLRMEQHESYIKSFEEFLRKEEIDNFLGNENLKKIKKMFTDQRFWALAIYDFFLTIALLVVIVSIMLL